MLSNFCSKIVFVCQENLVNLSFAKQYTSNIVLSLTGFPVLPCSPSGPMSPFIPLSPVLPFKPC